MTCGKHGDKVKVLYIESDIFLFILSSAETKMWGSITFLPIYKTHFFHFNTLESNVNSKITKVYTWLCANKLSLNIDKSSFALFHAPQRKIRQNFYIAINNEAVKQSNCIKYLGTYIDPNLSWKPQAEYIAKKIKLSIGLISKLRYYVNSEILNNLYYTLIYPFLMYGLIAWGNT